MSKNITQGIIFYKDLLNRLADPTDEDVDPEWFENMTANLYQYLLSQLEAYLLEGDVFHQDRFRLATEQLGILRQKAAEIEANSLDKNAPDYFNEYHAALASYVVGQMEEAIEFIKPENLLKV